MERREIMMYLAAALAAIAAFFEALEDANDKRVEITEPVEEEDIKENQR